MIVELEGPPIAKQRHRYVVRNGYVTSYDPQEDVKQTVRWLITSKLPKRPKELAKLCYKVTIEFHMPLPSSWSSRKSSLIEWLGDHLDSPDVDNLAKFYLDCANGLLWIDDKQITSLSVVKLYSQNPRTVINIFGMEPMALDEQAEGILGLFDQVKFNELISDMFAFTEAEMLAPPLSGHNGREAKLERASRAALLLSKMADKYGDELKKIKKAYPGYWQNHLAKERHDDNIA